MLRSPSEGRYQTVHVFSMNTVVDLKGSAGDKVAFPVMHEAIEILYLGWQCTTDPGAVTTGGVLTLDKIPNDNGTRVNKINSLAELTFHATNDDLNQQRGVDLNESASNTPVAGRSYPTAVRGDTLVLELTTQGVGGGAQDVKPFILYRERPLAIVS